MIAQRAAGSATVVRATAEQLPFQDDSFDAALAVLTDHHWSDRHRALRELRRVARRRVVLFNADPSEAKRFWLTDEYLPGFLDLIPEPFQRPGAWRADFADALGSRLTMEPVPIPHDCLDGFYGAFWRRPRAYLDPSVRNSISVFARLAPSEVATGIQRLKHDLATGVWQTSHSGLLNQDALDLGYVLVTAELA